MAYSTNMRKRCVLGGYGHDRESIASCAASSISQCLRPLTGLHNCAVTLKGALNNGVTVEELREIFLHTTVYCGLPAAGDAFRVAQEVLKSRDLLE